MDAVAVDSADARTPNHPFSSLELPSRARNNFCAGDDWRFSQKETALETLGRAITLHPTPNKVLQPQKSLLFSRSRQ